MCSDHFDFMIFFYFPLKNWYKKFDNVFAISLLENKDFLNKRKPLETLLVQNYKKSRKPTREQNVRIFRENTILQRTLRK